MSLDPLSAVLDLSGKVIDKIFPDPAQRDQAKLELLKMQRDGELKRVELQLSAIIAEAQSQDPWTSRARPSFLYVVYLLLLWAIPMGLLTILNPEAAQSFTRGFQAWMGAIPEPVLALFGTVMTGYVLGRSWEKVKGRK